MAQDGSGPGSGRPGNAVALPPADEGDLFTIRLPWRRWWTVLPEIVLVACCTVIPTVVFLNFLSRYTDWFRIYWAEDVVKVSFLWLIFLGGAVAVKYDAHVRMALVSDRMERADPPLSWWPAVVRASPLIAGIVLIVLGRGLVEISMFRELPSLELSAGYFMTVVPISGGLMIVYVLRDFWIRYRTRTTPSRLPAA